MGKSWSPLIGHGCSTDDEKVAWVKAQNKVAGMALFRVEGLPPRAKKPKDTPQVAEEPKRPSLTFVEFVIAERTLGLDRSNAISKNSFQPENDAERKTCAALILRGLMRVVGDVHHMTSEGLAALEEKRPLMLGIIG